MPIAELEIRFAGLEVSRKNAICTCRFEVFNPESGEVSTYHSVSTMLVPPDTFDTVISWAHGKLADDMRRWAGQLDERR